MSFIKPYPKRGEMDEWKPGMDDEATPDPDPLPYLQEDLIFYKTRTQGGGMADCTPEENIDLMTQVMSNPALHINAAKAYKHTGTTNAFNGTEDDMIAGDAKVFWDELDMRRQLTKELKEIEDLWIDGKFQWNIKM